MHVIGRGQWMPCDSLQDLYRGSPHKCSHWFRPPERTRELQLLPTLRERGVAITSRLRPHLPMLQPYVASLHSDIMHVLRVGFPQVSTLAGQSQFLVPLHVEPVMQDVRVHSDGSDSDAESSHGSPPPSSMPSLVSKSPSIMSEADSSDDIYFHAPQPDLYFHLSHLPDAPVGMFMFHFPSRSRDYDHDHEQDIQTFAAIGEQCDLVCARLALMMRYRRFEAGRLIFQTANGGYYLQSASGHRYRVGAYHQSASGHRYRVGAAL